MPVAQQTIALGVLELHIMERARMCPCGTVTTRMKLNDCPTSELRYHLAAVWLQTLGYLKKNGATTERTVASPHGQERVRDWVWELTDEGRAAFPPHLPPDLSACEDDDDWDSDDAD